MNKDLLRDKAWNYFGPVLHALGKERIEDKAHGYIEGYQEAVRDVQAILNNAGELGDGDYVSNAVNILPEEFDGEI